MKLNDFINEHLEKPIGLFSGYIFFIAVLVSFKTIFPVTSQTLTWIILGSVLIVWSFIWYLIRITLPRNKKNRLGIILSISTETDKQKIRLKNDFLKRLKDQANKNGIDILINFIQIGSTKTLRVNKILTDYLLQSRYKNSLTEDAKKSIKTFNSLKNRIRGHFYIWGDIKERLDIEKKYFLELDGLVLHTPLNDPIKTRLGTELAMVWARSINFQEKIEFKGFLLSADVTFIAVEYILGLAAFFSGNVELAENLHTRLESSIPKEIEQLPNIKHIKKSLCDLIPIEFNIASVIQLNKGNAEQAEEYLRKSFQRQPENNYSALITQSIIQFQIKGDPNTALSTVRKAKKCSGNDGTWRYNEAFLLMYLGKFDDALVIYKDITRINFLNEDRVLGEILNFNKNMIAQNSQFYQSYFILGYLFYKKVGNFPEAFNYFDQFVTNCKGSKFKILIEIAVKCLDILKLRMELK
jgi:hypothetical protein